MKAEVYTALAQPSGHPVYPGHPLVLACYLRMHFKSADEALEPHDLGYSALWQAVDAAEAAKAANAALEPSIRVGNNPPPGGSWIQHNERIAV